jgi:hypothetical protein
MSKINKKEVFLENFKKSFGMISVACDATGISRQTFYNWKDTDPEFQKGVEETEERNLDFAEMKLMSAIREGKTTELLFYLKTKGKRRGYIEGTQLLGSDGNAITAFTVEVIAKNENTED